jgi:phage tail protein X
MPSYTTRKGDTLDYIVFNVYGTTANGAVEEVLNLNPHLTDYPPTLPYGVEISLPEQLVSAQPNEQVVTLW